MCLICEMHGHLDFTTLTFLLEGFMAAIKKLYCQNNDIKPTKDLIQVENIERCMEHVAAQAFTHMIKNNVFFQYEVPNRDIDGIEISDPILEFGLLQVRKGATLNSEKPPYVFFTNKIFQEYLAGWHISRMSEEAFSSYHDTLVNDKHMHRVCVHFCGLLRFNMDHPQLKLVFESFIDLNRDQWRATPVTTMPTGSIRRRPSTSMHPSGRLQDFTLSLQCICEVEGRKDLVAPLLPSFPRKMTMRHHEVPDIQVISGLAKIMKMDAPSIADLDIRLDHFARYQEYTFLVLGDSIEQSKYLANIKLQWTSDELLALFLANVFGDNHSITTIR